MKGDGTKERESGAGGSIAWPSRRVALGNIFFVGSLGAMRVKLGLFSPSWSCRWRLAVEAARRHPLFLRRTGGRVWWGRKKSHSHRGKAGQKNLISRMSTLRGYERRLCATDKDGTLSLSWSLEVCVEATQSKEGITSWFFSRATKVDLAWRRWGWQN